MPFAAKKAKKVEETHSSTSTKDRTEEKKEEAKPQPEEQPAAGPWDVLRVCRGASKDEIRRAYRELAKKWHPDRFATEPTEMQDFVATRMQNINRAYDVLV